MIYFLGNKDLFSNDFNYCVKEQILEYCNSKSVLGFDIETTRKYSKNKYNEDIYQPGLDPYMTKTCMVQIGDLDNQFVIDARTNSPNFLKEILENKNILKIGQNLKFEGKHFLLNHNIHLVNIWDTMICEKILYNGLSLKNSLAALTQRYLDISEKPEYDLFEHNNVEEEEDLEFDDLDFIDYKEKVWIDKSIRQNFVNIGDRPFTKEEVEYGVNDIIYPIKIWEIQKKGRVLDDGKLYKPDKGFYLENKFTQVLARMELRGITVNVEGWKELYNKNKNTYIEKINRLNNWVVKNHKKFATQLDLFNPEPNCSIDWRSPKEVIKFAKYLDICPKEKSKFTGRMEFTVGAKAMFKLLNNENKDKFYKSQELEFGDKDDTQAFILNFLLSKKYQQLTTTFGIEWLRYVHPITGRVHSSFQQLMNTGRMSSYNPNQQQIPSGKEWRSLFITKPDYNLVSTDFDSQELKIAAEVTNVKSMQDFFIHKDPIFGSDMHSFTATKMFRVIRNQPDLIINKEDHKKERNVAKAMGFKLNYGGGEFTIAQEMGIDTEEALKFVQGYFDGFPGLEQNFVETKKLAVKRGWIELDSYTGKKYFFKEFSLMQELYKKAMSYYPENYRTYSKEKKEEFKIELKISNPEVSILWKEYMILKGKLERASLNFRIQGLAASMSKVAAILIENKNFSLDEGLLLIVHDEMVEEYKIKDCQQKSDFTKECFTKAGTFFCKTVPMSGTSEIGSYWIH